MAYLDPIELFEGEELPPRYRLCKAGARDSKIAVIPGNVGSTYGRYPKTPEGRAAAIQSAWETFGWTPHQWMLIKESVRMTYALHKHQCQDGEGCEICQEGEELKASLE